MLISKNKPTLLSLEKTSSDTETDQLQCSYSNCTGAAHSGHRLFGCCWLSAVRLWRSLIGCDRQSPSVQPGNGVLCPWKQWADCISPQYVWKWDPSSLALRPGELKLTMSTTADGQVRGNLATEERVYGLLNIIFLLTYFIYCNHIRPFYVFNEKCKLDIFLSR